MSVSKIFSSQVVIQKYAALYIHYTKILIIKIMCLQVHKNNIFRAIYCRIIE